MTGRPVARVPSRHDLAVLHPAAGDALRPCGPDGAAGASLRRWIARGRPAVVRRAAPGDRPGCFPLAVAFPPAARRRLLAFDAPASAVARVGPPPSLADACGALPDRHRERAEAVLAAASTVGLAPLLFGSAMWQHVTSLPYLHDRSDLDLFWPVPDAPDRSGRIGRLVAVLAVLDARPGPRLDGEIGLDGLGAVNWRELRPDAPTDCLVKTGRGVFLTPRARFVASVRADAAPCRA